MTEHSVVIAGGGPTGLMLAAELALAGVGAVIVERRTSHDLVGSRAAGVHARTVEVFDQRGVADRFLGEGKCGQLVHFAGIWMDVSDFPTRHPYALGLLQYRTERVLAAWVAELGVPVLAGREVTGYTQDESGVTVTLDDGRPLRARYLVGCDGGRSLVRKLSGVEFPGWEPSMSCLIADAELEELPDEWGLLRKPGQSVVAVLRFEEDGPYRVMVGESQIRTGEPTLDDVRAAMREMIGTDYGIHSPRWVSRFTDGTRQAASYRAGRVLLAGDAAHVHFPFGGQGLNLGVQDAVNLGWKLAAVVNGTAPEALLDTYHSERHPVAARVLHNTMAQTALSIPGERTDALRDIMSDLLALEEPRKRIAGMMSGLDIGYDCGSGHPQLGRRMPDLDIVTADGPSRVFALLHAAHPVLLNLGEPESLDIAGWNDRVRVVDAKYTGEWELPVLGAVSSPEAVLIRPDGHVAWVGEGSDAGLRDALATWFGPPRA